MYRLYLEYGALRNGVDGLAGSSWSRDRGHVLLLFMQLFSRTLAIKLNGKSNSPQCQLNRPSRRAAGTSRRILFEHVLGVWLTVYLRGGVLVVVE